MLVCRAAAAEGLEGAFARDLAALKGNNWLRLMSATRRQSTVSLKTFRDSIPLNCTGVKYQKVHIYSFW